MIFYTKKKGHMSNYVITKTKLLNILGRDVFLFYFILFF